MPQLEGHMHLNKYIFLFIIIVFASNCISEDKWENSLINQLTQMTKEKIDSTILVEEADELIRLASVLDYNVSFPALMSIWFQERSVELFWWKKDDPVTRAFIIALYICGYNEMTSVVPNFEYSSKRFNDEESLLRREELDFVRKNKSKLAKLLVKIYSINGKQNSSIFANYNSCSKMK